VGGVDFGELRLFGREFIQREHRIGWAHRHAGAAIDAIIRIHVELGRFRETGLILLGMNAVHRASLNAQFVFRTSVRNNVSHARNGAIALPAPLFSNFKKISGETLQPAFSGG
jgi:hypothetical protein